MAGPQIKIRNKDLILESLVCAPENFEGPDPQLIEFLAKAKLTTLTACVYEKRQRESLLIIDNESAPPAVGYFDLGRTHMSLSAVPDMNQVIQKELKGYAVVDVSGDLRRARFHETGGDVRALDFPVLNAAAAAQLVAEKIDKKRQSLAAAVFQEPVATITKAPRFGSLFHRHSESVATSQHKDIAAVIAASISTKKKK